ncbi:MAG: beta-ketoacyl-[acyl-carrier-protein] synthase family protein [Deltaproteobacteria bacterium]|nr:beta-ketoacyl-[acyl-carrier-protein] synthase family protein [Deltaproteobacteria bacterium]
MSQTQRVVVTGVGVVSALGIGESPMWENLLAGRSGIAPIQAFDTDEYRVKLGAEIDSDLLPALAKARSHRRTDRALDISIEAAGQALEQAKLIPEGPKPQEGYLPQEIPVILGSGVGPAQSLYTAFQGFTRKSLRGLRPTTVPRCMANSFSSGISIHYHLTGPNYVLASACTSSTNAIGDAFRKVQHGYASVVVCGGTEAFFDPFYYGVWNNLGVLATETDPTIAYRPFDLDRGGCLLGEGAGILVLESLDHARRRGALIRGEITGYGDSSDATHLTSPSPQGQARAIRAALDCAKVEPTDIGYINAHGTATRANDESESAAIRQALGAAADQIPVGANKSFFGHTLGASGAIETIVTLLSLENRRVPPNLNLDRPDPKCNLHFVGAEPLELEAPIAMKNSFGFGGGNAVLILKRYTESSDA